MLFLAMRISFANRCGILTRCLPLTRRLLGAWRLLPMRLLARSLLGPGLRPFGAVLLMRCLHVAPVHLILLFVRRLSLAFWLDPLDARSVLFATLRSSFINRPHHGPMVLPFGVPRPVWMLVRPIYYW